MKQIMVILAVVGGVSACANTTPQTRNATIGAGAGALAAEILDKDAATGALIGGAAGLACTESGACY